MSKQNLKIAKDNVPEIQEMVRNAHNLLDTALDAIERAVKAEEALDDAIKTVQYQSQEIDTLTAQLAEAQAKAEQAQADNATLVGVLKSIHRYIHPHNSLNYSGFIDDLIDSIKDTPHPGDPIRKELDQLWAVRGAAEAVLLMCDNMGDFRNGNTYQGIDEGQVMADKVLNKLRQALAQAKAGERHG